MGDRDDEDPLLHSPSINTHKVDTTDVAEKPCFPYRYQVVLLTCIGFVCGMSVRTSFNIALVDMVNFTSTNNYTSDECVEPNQPTANTTKKQHGGEFNWDSSVQSLLLGAFFYGYVLTQFLGGYVSEIIGPKRILFVAILVPGLLNIVSPWTAKWSPIALFITRFLMGLSQGPLYPSLTVLVRNWGRSDEVTIMYCIINTGATLGTFLGPVVTGALCDFALWDGWPLSFYIFGLLSVLWSLVWLCYGHSGPNDHPKLSSYERYIIMEGRSYSSKSTHMKRPVCEMMKSKAVWCVMVYFMFDGLSYYSIFSGLPIYMKQILKFDISENGFLNAVPYIGMMVTILLSGFLADWLRRNYISTKLTRKLFCLVGEGLQLGIILAIGFIPCNRTAVIVLYTVGVTINGLSVSGASVNWLDIAPRYAGTLMGISNLISNFGGFVSPLIIGAITKDSPRRSDWQTVFYLTAGAYGIGTLSFLLFGEGEEQPWAKEDSSAAEPIETDVQPCESSLPQCDNVAQSNDDIKTANSVN